VLVDFWDADCRFCEQDVSNLNALRTRFPDESFQSYVDENEIVWPQRQESGRYAGSAAQAFGLRAVPGHYAIDREGRFVHVPLGQPLDRVIAALLEE
jgi:hypothetical protein